MSTGKSAPGSRALLTGAAACWFLAVAVYLIAEAVAASAFPDYSYATNYISDLGVPEVAAVDGRAIDSPLHAVMNAGFIAHGVLFVLAALLATRAARVRHRRWFIALAVVHGVGIVLVGTFSGSQEALESGLAAFHVIGAAMAIIGGNLTAMVASRTARHGFAALSLALGVVGIVSVVMLVVDSGTTAINLLPDGIWERLSVYTIQAWELVAATATLVWLRNAPKV